MSISSSSSKSICISIFIYLFLYLAMYLIMYRYVSIWQEVLPDYLQKSKLVGRHHVVQRLPPKFEVDNIQNEAILRDFLIKNEANLRDFLQTYKNV